jgi:branched-chain amino acid transport system substrate-binding protein
MQLRLRLTEARRARIAIGALAPVVAACILLAGCGSGSTVKTGSASTVKNGSTSTVEKAASAAPKCGTGSGQAAKGTPILVGGMTTESGGANAAEGVNSAQAYFDCLNANGGIDGRPIKYIIEDDGLNPTTAARGAQTLVSDKVVGIVGASYLECAVAGPIYAKAGLYEIEGAGGESECFTSPNIASVSEGAPLAGSAITQALVGEGAKKIYLVLPNVPGVGTSIQQAARATATAVGAHIVGTTFFSAGVTNATSIVLAAQGSGADGIAVAGDKADQVTILQAAAAQHIKAKFGGTNQMYSPEVPGELGSYWNSGALVVQHQYAPETSPTPDVALWKAVVKAHAPAGTSLDDLSEGTFLAAKVFSDTIAKIKGPITAQSVGNALTHIKNYHTGMLCAPFSWGKLPFRASNVYTLQATVAGGTWQSQGGCKRINNPST